MAVLKVPEQLQPLDNLIMLGLYILYLSQALLLGRKEGEKVEWEKKEVCMVVAGFVVLGLGAYFTFRSTEKIVAALRLSDIIGGLFITASITALPEVFATWSEAKSG